MDRTLLVISTFCYLFGFGYTMYAFGARSLRPSRWNFLAMAGGFVFQTGFLFVRGQAIGRCPLSNLFEVLVFLCWSMVLFYLAIGPAYRLSLLGTFTSPLVFLIQIVALLIPPAPVVRATAVNPWLELHAALSVVAYGAFALACVAGVMYLAQERQLKTHHIKTAFYHLPAIRDLAVANSRLIVVGFVLFNVGLLAGISQGLAHSRLLWAISVGVWVLYGGLIVATFAHRVTPRKVAIVSISAFGVMLLTLQLVPSAARP
ncbi:MAG TPA: cytochrome c biogenesis protein CcsA [Chthoniobacteraceae bacterium]|jgi:ABC-type uncharacterized transport system permease subunit|nr:cytochrome c biogenesis protein CcsA [Chthoniobacteraceae bacterium]